MIEDRVREDIAFIRRAVEEGRTFATASSPDIMIWESRSPSVISAPTLSSGVGRPSIPAGRGPCASDCRGSIFAAPSVAGFRATLRRQSDGSCPLDAVVRLRRFPHYPRDRGDLGRRHPPGLVRSRRRRRPGIAFFVSAWLSNLGCLRWVALLW